MRPPLRDTTFDSESRSENHQRSKNERTGRPRCAAAVSFGILCLTFYQYVYIFIPSLARMPILEQVVFVFPRKIA